MIITEHPDGGEFDPNLKYLGYWAANEDPSLDHYRKKGVILPWPGNFVDLGWSEGDRRLLAQYLNFCRDVCHWRGFSTCRFCGTHLGSTDKSDGVYVWPDGFDHYVLIHAVRPPEEFLKHIRQRDYDRRSLGL